MKTAQGRSITCAVDPTGTGSGPYMRLEIGQQVPGNKDGVNLYDHKY